MDTTTRLAQWAENDMRAEGVALDAKYEIERLREQCEFEKKCRNDAFEELKKQDAEIERLREYERLVKFIANDYHELSYEKAQWQRDDWKNRCRTLQQKDSE
jgi:hypothetical protein